MASYQGPNVSVTQQFQTSPGAVAIESLPSAAVATAYDVYNKEALGDAYGIKDQEVLWGTDNAVVHDKSVAGQKALDFYPPVAYANTNSGNIDLEVTDADVSATGISIEKDTSYIVPGTEMAAGSCQAIIPYYKADRTTEILASDLQTVVITNGSVVTSQIKPGQNVFIYYSAAYNLVGTVGSIGSDENKITLATPFSGAVSGTKILVGAASAALHTHPTVLFDSTADFVSAKVAVGDIINLSSVSITGSVDTPVKASITAIINKNTLRFNSDVLAAGNIDSDVTKYYPQDDGIIIGSTIQLYSYSIKRLIGFSQNYLLKLKDSGTGVIIEGVSGDKRTLQISLNDVADLPALKKDDIIMVTAANVASGTDERDQATLNLYRIDTIDFDGSDLYTITTTEAMKQSESGSPDIANGNFLNAWHPVNETEIVADFRAIRSEEDNVVHRITSVQDIFTYYVRSGEESIDPRNELAFMLNAMFSRSGGKVCYGINVDSSTDPSTAYAAALEELKMIDVYSHAFGTTNSGVNGIVGAYCDEQSAPYEAHERIGIICYDTDDLYLMGTDSISGSVASGVITFAGAMNLLTAGVTVNDQVKLYDVNGDYLETATVLSTPTASNVVTTDTTLTTTPKSVRIESGRKDDQAVRAGNIKYGNRRVSMLFPGWFYGEYDGTRLLLPPYFIAASIAGMDSGVIASQPFTNMPFAIPGLSNIELGTNTYFKKTYLDVIGGGGVDILVQDTTISQNIKSRHDLTTNMDAVQYRERSITKQADVCAKTIRNAVNPYVGRYNVNDPNLFRFLGQVCTVVCTKLVSDGIIFNIAVTSIKRDEVIDDKINFFITATAFIAGNYYDITLLVKTR